MNKKQRIIFAISTSIAGGAQVYLYNIIEYIKDDYSVLVLCPKGFFYEKVKGLEGVDVIEQSIGLLQIGRLRQVLGEEIRKHGEVCVNAHLLSTGLWISEAMKGMSGIHLSITFHNKVIYDNISLLRKILYPVFIKRMARRSDAFIAVSQEIADSVTAFTGRACDYIPSSVPMRVEPKDVSKYSPETQEISVGFVGRVSSPKNPIRFVETAVLVAKAMPNVVFKVIGDGELRGQMEDCIKENKMENRFRIFGFLSNPASEMRKLDVLLLTSDYEGTPMVLLEAMSYGVPVVSTRVGGIPTVIENWKDGVLTDNFTPASIAEAVVALLKDKEKYVSISKCAYSKIGGEYSYERNITRYMRVVLNGNVSALKFGRGKML